MVPLFILQVEYGLVHRGDCINCEICYFCFDPAFVWPSLGRADFRILACKPFPGLCASLYPSWPAMRVSGGN